MGLFSLEHSKLAYRADFALYALAIVGIATYLMLAAAPSLRLEVSAYALAGLASWSLIEYLFHRFVLHGLQPFSRLHSQHHDRPAALICTPTILSAGLIACLVYLPALLLSDVWRAGALTLGVLIGYLAYSATHHATHHWHGNTRWLKQRKRWHALHHHLAQPCCYGVTSRFWDYIFGSDYHNGPHKKRVDTQRVAS